MRVERSLYRAGDKNDLAFTHYFLRHELTPSRASSLPQGYLVITNAVFSEDQLWEYQHTSEPARDGDYKDAADFRPKQATTES